MVDIRAAALAFEARKIAYRQSKDGIVLSLAVHPLDFPSALATSTLGTRYQVALVEIGDDEQPIPPEPEKPKDESRSRQAREVFQAKTPEGQAVVRAALLAKDLAFQQWAAHKWGYRGLLPSEPFAVEYIRKQCCGGESRGMIANGGYAYRAFLALETEYRAAAGQLAEIR